VNQRYLAIFAIAISYLSIPAIATEVLAVEVEIEGDIYRMHGESIIHAPAEFIYDILIDYDNFHRISNGIAESHFLPPAPDGVMMGYTRIDSCVWFYCREFEKVERVWSTRPTEIVTEIVPERSDFKVSNTRWTLQTTENGTLVFYDAEMDPDFWVPPVVGPWAFKKKLHSSAETIGTRIEYLLESGKSLSDFETEESAEALPVSDAERQRSATPNQ
jgi:hypothetical protein